MPTHDTSADVKIDAGGELAKAATEESTHVPRDERDGELQALRAKLAAAERSCAQMVEECEINARHHAAGIADPQKKHDNAILELKRSHLKEITALKESHVAEQRLVRVKLAAAEERASAKLSKLQKARDETMDKLGKSRQRSVEDEDATAAATSTKEAEDRKSRQLQAKSDELQILRDPFLRLQSQLPTLFQLGHAFAEASARQHGLGIVKNCCSRTPTEWWQSFCRLHPPVYPILRLVEWTRLSGCTTAALLEKVCEVFSAMALTPSDVGANCTATANTSPRRSTCPFFLPTLLPHVGRHRAVSNPEAVVAR